MKIDKTCPHCDPKSFAFNGLLKIENNFYITADVHPITNGHILIVPKNHYSCIGEYPKSIFKEFLNIYNKVSKFLYDNFGSFATFEHGILGQTIFHSHVHLFPFIKTIKEVIPEGNNFYYQIKDLTDLKNIFVKKQGYLFTSINSRNFIVDENLAVPGFFRHRFAKVFGTPELGSWKKMQENKKIMEKANKEVSQLIVKWKKFNN